MESCLRHLLVQFWINYFYFRLTKSYCVRSIRAHFQVIPNSSSYFTEISKRIIITLQKLVKRHKRNIEHTTHFKSLPDASDIYSWNGILIQGRPWTQKSALTSTSDRVNLFSKAHVLWKGSLPLFDVCILLQARVACVLQRPTSASDWMEVSLYTFSFKKILHISVERRLVRKKRVLDVCGEIFDISVRWIF